MKYDEVKKMYAESGYPFYEGINTINIFGIRKGYTTVNEFNDVLGFAMVNEAGEKLVITHKGTTKPGLYWLKNKLGAINGTFILEPGYYKHCWELRNHKGEYPALCQIYGYKGFWGTRDNNSDGKLDLDGPRLNDVTGLNSHHAKDKLFVGPYSAACQVRQFEDDHEEMMSYAVTCMKYWKATKMSYALFYEAV